MLRLEARRLDSFLRRHTELDDIQEHLQHCLILIVAARSRHGHHGLPIFHHQGRAERNARSLSGSELIRMPVLKNERLQTRTERNSGPVSYTHLTLPTICSV